jgi:hypothetical protein
VLRHVRDVSHDALELLARRAGLELGIALVLEHPERVGDERELVRPVPVNGRFADAGAAGDRLDAEGAVAGLA